MNSDLKTKIFGDIHFNPDRSTVVVLISLLLDDMLFLFGLGLVFAVVFRLTTSIFVLWPFYTPVGGLYTNLSEGLSMPFEASYSFLLTLGIMITIIAIAGRMYQESFRSREREPLGREVKDMGKSAG